MDLEEDAQWGVVQWSLPERLRELRKEQGGAKGVSAAWTVCLCICVCTQQ